jgi:hypothetical protein
MSPLPDVILWLEILNGQILKGLSLQINLGNIINIFCQCLLTVMQLTLDKQAWVHG